MARCGRRRRRAWNQRLLVHDAHAGNPEVAFALSRLADPTTLRTTAIGIYRDVHRATYDDLLHDQLAAAAEDEGTGDRETLEGLIAGNDTWTVGAMRGARRPLTGRRPDSDH